MVRHRVCFFNAIFFFTSIYFYLTSFGLAHVVDQLFVDFSLDNKSWSAEVRFDAGIALPEMRADKESLQPRRQWLLDKTPSEHAEIRKQTEIYLRECLHFNWVEKSKKTPLNYTIHFPEWDTNPPTFAKPFTDMGFAYFSVQCSGSTPKNNGSLEIHISDGDHPDFAIGYERMNSDRIITAYPGKSVILWTQMSTPPSLGKSFLNFLDYGFRHVIPEGLDHVLFIIALCLLCFSWKPLLAQSISFTLGHTCTLVLTICGILPAMSSNALQWVEICIAATIIYVALENIITQKLKSHRLLTIFIFGLIHGLGFASVLGESIRAAGNIAVPLLAANLGVELGQVSVIAATLIIFHFIRGTKFFSHASIAISTIIAMVATYWLFDRLIT